MISKTPVLFKGTKKFDTLVFLGFYLLMRNVDRLEKLFRIIFGFELDYEQLAFVLDEFLCKIFGIF